MKAIKEKKLLYDIQREKSPDAFAELYDHYISKMYRFVYFKLSNKEESEDLVSELFLKAWYYLTDDHNKDVRSFSGFIYRMARNMIVDVYRKRPKQMDLLNEHVGLERSPEASPFEQVAIKTEADFILKQVKLLKQEYQDIVLLRHVEGLSTAQIADILGKSKTNVRVTLHRAMKLLKEIVEEKQHDA